MINSDDFDNMVQEPGASYTQRNDEMNLAWQFIARTGISVFLTGKAGTGKTTFLRRLRELMPKRMVVLAPTGVAAINAGGQTIHSFFQLPFGPYVPGAQHSGGRTEFRMSDRKKALIRTLDLLVIDEVSMVRADMLDQVDDALRRYRDRTKPFGGVQLLLIGDLMQLSPVTRPEEWAMVEKYYDTPYFFSSLALKQLDYVTIELQRIYRQQNADFVNLLAKVRSNCLTSHDIEILNSRYIPDFRPTESGWVRLTTHNHMANSYNEACLAALDGRIYEFSAEIKGDFPEFSFPIDREMKLKTGAQVMFVKNDLSDEHLYYNGKIGVVHNIADNYIEVMCDDMDKPIEVTRTVWENTKYSIDSETKAIKEETVGTFTHFPLRLAWAITVHKSQGLTFDRAVLDISQSFAHGQAYVALSRCRSLDGVVLSSPMSMRTVISDATVNAFIDKSTEAIPENVARLPRLMRDYALALLDELYDFGQIDRDYKWLMRVVDEHLGAKTPRLLLHLKSLETSFYSEVCAVASKFGRQYHALVEASGVGIADATFQERLKKSCSYFRDKLKGMFAELLEDEVAVNIDNKQIASVYDNAVKALISSYNTKMLVLGAFLTGEFTVSAYLEAKAKALLDGELQVRRSARGRQNVSANRDAVKREAQPKRPKGSSVADTFDLLKKGMTPEEVATERKLVLSTIYGHICELVKKGDVKVDDVVSAERQKMIHDVVAGFKSSYTMKEVKELLPEDITYGEIKVVLCGMEI